MPKTPQRLAEPCPHEIRPGTKVCLHCRHVERVATRERRRRYMLRSSAVGVVVATLGTTGLLGAMVIRGRSPRAPEAPHTNVAVSAAPAPPRMPNLSSGNVAVAPSITNPIAPVSAGPTPVLPQGHSDLPDGISAMRTDSVVVLSFDTKLARTRMPEKFERFVRATLPAIYGAPADSALARIPEGDLARQGDLITELPTRGMRIPVQTGRTITLYPITRPGQDGPLVTRYRVVVVKG